MGAGIAQVLSLAGYETVGRDVSPDTIARAREIVADGKYGLRRAVSLGKITSEQADAALDRLTFTTDLEALADCDVVIEAVPEKLDLKVRVFREIDKVVKPSAVFASNSSGFPVAALAAATDRPQQVVAWHWASPVPIMNLAEIVRGPETSDETVDLVVRIAASGGKRPIVVKDAPLSWGYVANRVYAAATAEAHRVLNEGIATADEIDQLLVDCFRWPVGPFALAAGASAGWGREPIQSA